MFSKFIFLQSYGTSTLIKNYPKLLAFLNPCFEAFKNGRSSQNLGIFFQFCPSRRCGGIYELRQNKAYYAVLQVGIYEVGQKTCSTANLVQLLR